MEWVPSVRIGPLSLTQQPEGRFAKGHFQMTKDADDGHIEFKFHGWTRNLQERVRSNFIRVQVAYDNGDFVLTFQVNEIPQSSAQMEARLRSEIQRFADQMRAGATKPLDMSLLPPDAEEH